MRTEESRPRGESEAAEERQLPASVSDALREAVTLSRGEFAMLVSKAAAWDSVVTYAERLNFRSTSSAISAAEDWRAVAGHPSYAELERRRGRAVPPLWCDWKLCGEGGTPHRSPVTRAPIVLCPEHSHLGIPEAMPVRLARGEAA